MDEPKIQWHPGFYAGMELELKAFHLVFEKEFQLTRGPLAIDLLIIKKQKDQKIDYEIGEIFLYKNLKSIAYDQKPAPKEPVYSSTEIKPGQRDLRKPDPMQAAL